MAVECLRRCAGCRSCRFVSFSVDWKECSWFRTCNFSGLVTQGTAIDFQTGRVRHGRRNAFAGGGAAPRNASSVGQAWLSRAVPGYCATTEGESDCSTGQRGTLPLPNDEFLSGWDGAAEACLLACGECARCTHISVSLKYRDCSWFHDCDLASTQGRPKPGSKRRPLHRSGPATPQDAKPLSRRGAAKTQEATRQKRLIAVTTTFPHAQQLPKLQHCWRRLGVVESLFWIVVEDANVTTPAVGSFLRGTGAAYAHLAKGPSRAKGHVQRNLAYAYIRDQRLDGVVYNVDDDNEYDTRLWVGLQQLRDLRVGAVAVQLSPSLVERPLYDRSGRFSQFKASWCYNSFLALANGNRKFCIDMAGFAFDAKLIHARPDPIWNFKGRHNHLARQGESQLVMREGGYTAAGGATWRGGESEFIESLIDFPEDLEPLANCGRDVLVFHNGWEGVEQGLQRPWVGRTFPLRPCKSDGW